MESNPGPPESEAMLANRNKTLGDYQFLRIKELWVLGWRLDKQKDGRENICNKSDFQPAFYC
jgi:hypothetical protein